MASGWFRKAPDRHSELARARAAMARAEALVHFGTWQWDPVENRTTWSDELHRIYGVEPGEFEGTLEGYLNRVHPDDRALVAETVQRALAEKTGFRMRERILRPDGEERVLSTAGEVLTDDIGNVTGMYGACHDITEAERSNELRRQMEEQRLLLEQRFFQSQKLEAVGRLAGGIAHDFNNMLLIILGSVSLLMDRIKDDDPAWQDLKAIEDAADRASALTRQLLVVARRQTFTTADVDLNTVIRQMEDMLRRSLGDDVRLRVQLADEPLVVRADPSQLNQVLLNLAVNARDAMPEGGLLTIASMAENRNGTEQAIIEVTDTGRGMDADMLTHVFEPFYTTKGDAGTGLGLATVYGIVTQSGGTINVRSRPGEGASFRICLPRLRGVEASDVERPALSPTGGGTETLLVVDDSEEVLSLTGRILSGAGYTVLTAPSGQWALSVAQRHAGGIDLLLTDVTMPGMSGPQLAERLAATRPNLRVLFMSGYQRTTDGVPLVPPGAHLLAKPFRPDALLAELRKALDDFRNSATG